MSYSSPLKSLVLLKFNRSDFILTCLLPTRVGKLLGQRTSAWEACFAVSVPAKPGAIDAAASKVRIAFRKAPF